MKPAEIADKSPSAASSSESSSSEDVGTVAEAKAGGAGLRSDLLVELSEGSGM